VLALYELEPVPRIIIDAEKRFILDKQGLPIVKDTEKFQSSHLGKVVKTLENRDFIMGFGNRNNNVWDYMVDVCFFSYLLSTKILPLDIKNLEKFGFNELKYMVVLKMQQYQYCLIPLIVLQESGFMLGMNTKNGLVLKLTLSILLVVLL
jgi:hypothetical protein